MDIKVKFRSQSLVLRRQQKQRFSLLLLLVWQRLSKTYNSQIQVNVYTSICQGKFVSRSILQFILFHLLYTSYIIKKWETFPQRIVSPLVLCVGCQFYVKTFVLNFWSYLNCCVHLLYVSKLSYHTLARWTFPTVLYIYSFGHMIFGI